MYIGGVRVLTSGLSRTGLLVSIYCSTMTPKTCCYTVFQIKNLLFRASVNAVCPIGVALKFSTRFTSDERGSITLQSQLNSTLRVQLLCRVVCNIFFTSIPLFVRLFVHLSPSQCILSKMTVTTSPGLSMVRIESVRGSFEAVISSNSKIELHIISCHSSREIG